MQRIPNEETLGAAQHRLKPVERQTMQDRVYAELRRALISGMFEPGRVLTLRDLASSMRTSAMPVREALGRLISENALEAEPNRSVRVPPITPERLDDLQRTRALIEGEAIVLASANMSARELALLKDTLAEWNEIRAEGHIKDFDKQAALNQKFHFQIYQASGSPILLRVIESLWLQAGPCTRYAAYVFAKSTKPLREPDVAHFHRLIVDALERRDPQAARVALIDDISRSLIFLRQHLLAQSDSQQGAKDG